MPADGPGTLKAVFLYPDMVATAPQALRELCPQHVGTAVAFAAIAGEVAVGAAVKGLESLIDAAAAKTQAEATILDATCPLAGFFDATGALAVDGGCLIFHNAANADLSDATILASFVLVPSFDRSAFRFDVYRWKFTRFLQTRSTRWFQKAGSRDLILKIEFLTPGSAGLGTRSVYVEHAFYGVDAAALGAAFSSGQALAWFAVPAPPTWLPDAAPAAGKYLPLNVRVTVVETSQPNQIARWLQDVTKERKADVSLAVKDALQKALQKALDPGAAAVDAARLAELAAVAYSAYKTSWDDSNAGRDAKPTPLGSSPSQQEIDRFTAANEAWRAGMIAKTQLLAVKHTLARAAFRSAGLRWPGELPPIAAV